MKTIAGKSIAVNWVGAPPGKDKRVALLIPQHNESSRCNMLQRLHYFKVLSERYRSMIDVIIIDDGSTDDSADLIRSFKAQNPDAFFVSMVLPNVKKVGALCLTSLSIEHEFVILSDFDTDIIYLDKMPGVLEVLNNDASLMGCYFRMLPNFGSGVAFQFQKLEYSLARSLYKLVEVEKSVPVMPGAGSCYKRTVLNSIYTDHSGKWCGEDRESTLIGLKLGYKTFYVNQIVALTRPPHRFKDLVKQRVRWNLGYIETFFKEKDYYLRSIRKVDRIGIRTLIDLTTTVFVVLFPLIILAMSTISWHLLTSFIIASYLMSIFWCIALISICPDESREIKRKGLYSILYYPIIKMVLDYIAWTGAFSTYFRNERMLRS